MKEPTQERPSIDSAQFTPIQNLRDFTTTWRVLPISGLAVIIGVLSASVAVALLKLINFFTSILRVPPSLRWRRVEEKNGRVG